MSDDSNQHVRTVREQFRIQVTRFEESVGGVSNAAIGPWIVGNLRLTGSETALDVATGTGIMARDLAPHVAHATGIDVTPEMLDEARRQAADRNVTNVTFVDGDATELPFPNDHFDLVISRIAIHHFVDPTVELGEMRRVCKPDGRVAIVDITTSDDPQIADTHNRLERMRDPSHTTAFSFAGLQDLAARCNLNVVHASQIHAIRELEQWMNLTVPSDTIRQQIIAAYDAEIAGGAPTGMLAHRADGQLKFVHHWAVLLCELTR